MLQAILTSATGFLRIVAVLTLMLIGSGDRRPPLVLVPVNPSGSGYKIIGIALLLVIYSALVITVPGHSGEKLAVAQKQVAGAKRGAAQVKIDVCSLLKKAEVEAVLGVPIEKVELISPLDMECVYSGGTLRDFRTLYLEIKTDAAGWFKATKKHSGSSLQPIPDLGDEAFWLGGDTNKLYVLKKGTVIKIAMSRRPELGPPVEAAKAVAQKVLARLP